MISIGFLGFITVMLFLFCKPDLGFALAPQPLRQIYALALGNSSWFALFCFVIISHHEF